ncbi:AI-2E family transporter [Ferruginibacter sp.]
MQTSPNINSSFRQWPYSARLCFKLLLLVLIALIIMACKPVLVPLYFSVLLSILLLPLTNLLEQLRFPRALAAIVSVLIALLVIAVIIYLLSAQIAAFLNDIPSIKKNLGEHYETIQRWVEQRFNISTDQQKSLVNNAASNIQDSGIVYVKQTFFTVTETLAFLIFSLIYSFLILFYRHTIRRFLFAVFQSPHKKNVDAVITGTKLVIKNYMTGLLIEMVIISACNTLLFTIVGIKYAVFLGVFTGILNIIPYIGIYTGIVFTALITLTTPASMSQVLWVSIGLLVIHFIDSNFLMPRIVGSKVKINALITILGAVTGGFLIGIPGVFFALPTIAILKIIFDRIEVMRPWSILMGDEPDLQSKRMRQQLRKKLAAKKAILSSPGNKEAGPEKPSPAH